MENNMIQCSSSSPSYISDLSDGLLIEILCRVDSSKTATKCKCVSKRWFSLVDTDSHDSYFLRCWREIHGREDSIALLTQYQECDDEDSEIENHHALFHPRSFNNQLPVFKPLHFLPCSTSNINVSKTLNPIRILAVFKDLVLCSPSEDDHSVYYICNPFTAQWMTLPPPPPLPQDPVASDIQVGVIVSENSHDFKVVRVIPIRIMTLPHEPPRRKYKVEIFSSEDGEWKEMILPKVFCWVFRLVFYDGMLVWYNKSEKKISGFKFDPNSDANSYARFSLPEGYFEGLHRVNRTIGVCKGCLRIAKLFSVVPNYGMRLIVWELNRHSQCWKLVNELDFSEIEDSTDASIARLCYQTEEAGILSWVLAFHPQDEDTLYLILSIGNGCPYSYIFSCNLRKKTLEVIHEFDDLDCDGFPLVMPSWPTPLPL